MIKTKLSPTAPTLDGQLCFALYSASLAMTKAYRPLLAPLGLTYPQYVVMLALWEHQELSVGALGDRVALDSGTLVPLLRKLKTAGLIDRMRSPHDDRSVLLSVTSAGRRLQHDAIALQGLIQSATGCSDPQRRTLLRGLRKLRTALADR